MKNGYYDVTPVYENTTMKARYVDDVIGHYRIYPVEGYVLHDKALDWEDAILDENGNPVMEFDPETGAPIFPTELKLGYTTGSATVPANYDFAANPREFYAVLADSVPDNQIFGGGGNNEHEVLSEDEETVTE